MKIYVNNVKVKLYLELEMIKCIITYEYYKAIQNAAFEEYLIICENKFLIR